MLLIFEKCDDSASDRWSTFYPNPSKPDWIGCFFSFGRQVSDPASRRPDRIRRPDFTRNPYLFYGAGWYLYFSFWLSAEFFLNVSSNFERFLKFTFLSQCNFPIRWILVSMRLHNMVGRGGEGGSSQISCDVCDLQIRHSWVTII